LQGSSSRISGRRTWTRPCARASPRACRPRSRNSPAAAPARATAGSTGSPARRDLGIEPLGPALENGRAETDKAEALKKKLIERAEVIRSRCKEAPAPPPEMLGKDAGDEGDEKTSDQDEQALEAA
jgi:hypothetical protein